MAIDLRLAVTDNVVGDLAVHMKCPDEIHGARLGGKKDKTSSLAIYPDNIHCYGCRFHLNLWQGPGEPPPGDVHPLTVLLGMSNEEAYANQARYSSEALDAYRERVEVQTTAEPLHPVLADIYHDVLMIGPRWSRKGYLIGRGLETDTLAKAKIGHDGQRFVIPIFDEQANLLTLRYRRDEQYITDPKYPKYSGMSGRNGFFLYPLHMFDYESDTLVICEGEFDALMVTQLGINAITATNGAGQAHKIPAIVKERWPRITHICIATDQDEAGNEAARLTLQAATELGFTAKRLVWQGGKDVTDAIGAGTFPLTRHR